MIEINKIISEVNKIFKQDGLQEIKDYVSSHISKKDKEICKRK
jgi:hypothetical protein